MLSVLPGMLPGKVPLNEKAGFFRAKKSMGKTCGLRARTGIRSRNWWLGAPIQFLQIWKNQLFTWWATVTLNHLLFSTLFSKEVWSWAKVCSKFSLLCFPFVFASLLSTRKRQSFFPQSCVPREAKCANSYRIIATNSWENFDSTSAHMVLYPESEKKTFQKKGELSKLTKNSWTCSSPAT